MRTLRPLLASAIALVLAFSAACSSDDGSTASPSEKGGASGASGSSGAAGAATGGASGTGGAAGGAAGQGGASTGGSSGAAGTGGAAGSSGGSAGTAGSAGAAPLYLVTIDHVASPSKLLKVDVQTGASKVACTLPASVDAINYPSSTFSRKGILFASNYQDGTLDTIDPCTCAVNAVGKTGYTMIPGITANKFEGLFAIETAVDALLDLDTKTGVGTKVGDLGADFVNSGLTWSDAMNGGSGGLYGINSATNGLYSVDPTTGKATLMVTITGMTFDSVGIELHPANGLIYACTNGAVLHSIDPATGVATAIGTGMGHEQGTCNNLAAPWVKVGCLDAL